MAEGKNLIRFINSEDISSFENLFRSYYPQLKRYTLHLLHNEAEADDLVQDVFLQLWSKRELLDEQKNGEAFLFTILKNKCLNTLKKKIVEGKYIQRQGHFETERLYHLSLDQTSEFESMKDRLSLELEPMINEMPKKCATAFRLKWMEGKKIKEIADIMNISTTMVDKHLAKGMEIARKKVTHKLLLLLLLLP